MSNVRSQEIGMTQMKKFLSKQKEIELKGVSKVNNSLQKL